TGEGDGQGHAEGGERDDRERPGEGTQPRTDPPAARIARDDCHYDPASQPARDGPLAAILTITLLCDVHRIASVSLASGLPFVPFQDKEKPRQSRGAGTAGALGGLASGRAGQSLARSRAPGRLSTVLALVAGAVANGQPAAARTGGRIGCR